jgi:hypothetical protein
METRVLAVMRTTPGKTYSPGALARQVGSVNACSVVNVLRGLTAVGLVEKVAPNQWRVPCLPDPRGGSTP